ncbi:hypothetical protein NA57DRAFT_53423 [Rhizodiscina lignyota]|uniref:Uncharacterized protein n=1 Tax=Rhizodiscina lignyota TaxID=1504668 RepID=A0A9P4MBJ5_9PEZI|nr:hypothetical protein NA57DRAFT_53423 [Rhizodiscina lignyota]
MTSSSKADECPPSYEESEEDTFTSTAHMLSGPGIVSEVEYSRQEVVRSAIENHILPVLRRQANYGLAKSTTVLEAYEPSSVEFGSQKSNDGRLALREFTQAENLVLSDSSNQQKGPIVSHEGENLTMIQLQGQENSAEFWSQPSAIKELQRQLHDILCASTVFEGVEFQAPKEADSAAEPSKGTKGWGKKLMKEFAKPRDEIALAHPPKNSQGVQLSVEREDVVWRTQNDFGLYENVTKPGIIVRVEVLC